MRPLHGSCQNDMPPSPLSHATRLSLQRPTAARPGGLPVPKGFIQKGSILVLNASFFSTLIVTGQSKKSQKKPKESFCIIFCCKTAILALLNDSRLRLNLKAGIYIMIGFKGLGSRSERERCKTSQDPPKKDRSKDRPLELEKRQKP